MKSISVADGVVLNVLPSEKFKTNFFSVNFITPLTEKDASGTALLSRVLLRACGEYPTTALLASRLEYLYDMSVSMRSYKRGENLVTSYECEFLKDFYVPDSKEKLVASAAKMFQSLFFCPLVKDGGFDGKILSEEKTDLVNAINSLINNKNAYAKQRCTSIMCENESYSINELGSEKDAKAFTEKSLYEYYLSFVKSARVEIYFIGEADESELADLFKKIFDSTERDVSELEGTYVTDKAHEPTVEVRECMPVKQGKLAMGFRTGVVLTDENSAAFSMFCEIFGGSPVSKLFMNVREKMSLCYYCRSVSDAFKGVMFVLSGIENQNREKAVEAIKNELSEMQKGNFTQKDISAALLSLTNSYRELADSCSGLSSWYLSRRLCGDNSEPEDVIERLKSVTAEEIAQAAKRVKLDTVYFLEGTDESEAEN